MADQNTNVIDISKFFGGKTLSSADVRVNTSTVLKTEPSFIAAPELARLLDVIATSTEESKTQVEQIKSIERVREREIITREQSDSRFQQALKSMMDDVAGLKNVYKGLINTLQSDRKLKEQELRDAEDKQKILKSEESEVRKGMIYQSSMVKPTKSFMTEYDLSGAQDQQQEESDSGGGLATAIAAAGTAGLIGGMVSGEGDGFEDGGTPGSGGKLQPIHKQALDIISGPESGGDYNAMNNGKAGDRPGGSKKWLGKNLTEMTIGEIKQHQNVKKDLWAAGRYQFIPNTLSGVASSAGLKDADLFDKNNQDLMGITLVKQRGIQPWTVGGSKYSKEELAIVEKARKTPLQSSEEATAQGQSKTNQKTTQSTTAPKTSPTGQQVSVAPGTSATGQQIASAVEPSVEGQQIASTVEPSTQGKQSRMGASDEPTRELTPNLTEPMVESTKPDRKVTPDKITPPNAGMSQNNVQIAVVPTSPPAAQASPQPSAPAPSQGITLFSPINSENLFMLSTARELNLV